MKEWMDFMQLYSRLAILMASEAPTLDTLEAKLRYEAVLVWPPGGRWDQIKGMMEEKRKLTGIGLPFLPDAPLAACLASSNTTLRSGRAVSKLYAIDAPDMPDPTITTSAVVGNSGVVLWSAISLTGCHQYDDTGLFLGRPGGIAALVSIVAAMSALARSVRRLRVRLIVGKVRE
jgi:hypothetical protein